MRKSLRYLDTISKVANPSRGSPSTRPFSRATPSCATFPGIRQGTAGAGGSLTSAQVRPDFMEKESVVYLEESRVDALLRAPPSSNGKGVRIKPYIRPALLIALKEIRGGPSNHSPGGKGRHARLRGLPARLTALDHSY